MLRQTLADGPRIAVATILGTVTGLGIWSAAAGAGLSAALLADPAIYHGLLLAGGGVLIVIGLRTAWSAVCRPAVGPPTHPAGPDTPANGAGGPNCEPGPRPRPTSTATGVLGRDVHTYVAC